MFTRKMFLFLAVVLFLVLLVFLQYSFNKNQIPTPTTGQFLVSKTFLLQPGQVQYYGGNHETPEQTLTYRYVVDSDQPVQIYIVPSYSDFQLISTGREFLQYPTCRAINSLRYDQPCTISSRGGIAIQNEDAVKSSTVKLDVYRY